MNSKQRTAFLRFAITKLSGSHSDAAIAHWLGEPRRRVQKIRQRLGISKGRDALRAAEDGERGVV